MKNLLSFLKTREKLGALVFYILVVAAVYSPVIFFGKSLQSPIAHPDTVLDSGAYGYEGRRPFSAFNVDVSAATFSEFPVNKLVGDIYKSGSLPLWNPYKGLGEPMPEQLGSAVFFPYQILEDLAPVWAWDYFYLGRLLIAGFFTFLFLRLLKVSQIGSLLGGLVYMFSGSFTWFINNELTVNSAMMLPVVFWSLEGLLQSLSPRYVVFLAVSFALILVSAPPGVTLYALLLVFSFCLFRIISSFSLKGRRILLLLFVFLTAVALTAPLLLPFFDFLGEALSLREGSGLASVSPINFTFVVFPGLSYFPVDYRFISNGLWDDVGSYVGVLPIFLIIAGLILIRRFSRGKGLFLFFTGFGVFVLLKNYGFLFFPLLGKLPLFNVVWSPRWSGPAWSFAFAVATALSFEVIRKNQADLSEKVSGFVKKWPLKYWLAISGLMALVAYFYKITFDFVIGYGNRIFMIDNPPVSSWIFYLVVSAIILFVAIWLLFCRKGDAKDNLLAILVLLVLELWLWIPAGYHLAEIKLLPFFLGLLAILAVASGLRKRALIFGFLFLISFNLIDYFSPFGLPSRHNPLNQPPYIDYLKKQEGFFRSVGTQGILTPNFSGAYGLADIRHISGSVIKSFYGFKKQVLNVEEYPFWFMNTPFSLSPPDSKAFPFLCARKEYSPAKQKSVLAERLPFYSLLGVKYILTPNHSDISDFFDVRKSENLPLVYDREVKIYQNLHAFPRAFIAYKAVLANSYDNIFETLTNFSVSDLRERVLLEEPLGKNISGGPGAGKAIIKSYLPNRVIIDAYTNKAGILVLTDQFYPGWQAKVNGNVAKIYRIDGLFRGVYLEPGNSQIIFSYEPLNFRLGLYVAILAILNLALLVYILKTNRSYLLPLVIILSFFIVYYPSRGFWDYLKNRALIHSNPTLIVKADSQSRILWERRRREMNFVSQKLIQLLPALESKFLIDGFQFPEGLANPFQVDYRSSNGKKKRILIRVVKKDDPEYSYNPNIEPLVDFILKEHVESRRFIASSKFFSEKPIPLPIYLYKDVQEAGILRLLFFYWRKDDDILETRLYLTSTYYEFEEGRWKLVTGDEKLNSQLRFKEGFHYDCDTATWKKIVSL